MLIDADRHVIEPIDLWKRYLEEPFRAHAPSYEDVGRSGRTPRLMLQGEPVHHKLSERAVRELSAVGSRRSDELWAGRDPAAQIRAMDRAHVDMALFFPTTTLFLLGIDTIDPALAGAFTRAYNRWLHDFCAHDPARLRGVGVVNVHDPAAMVEDLACIAAWGWTAVVLRPNPVKGRLLSDPAYEPFWAACERLDVAVALHEGAHARVPTAGADRFESRFALHACSHPMEQMMAFLALVEGGVLERHPGLRVAFLEAGCGWLPYWLWRLDEIEYRNLSGEVAENVRRKPSEYFRRQCFVAIEPDEPYLPELIPYIGEDNLIFGTDFPHLDHDSDITEKLVPLGQKLPGNVLQKILRDNPARLYRLEGV
ncbi:amidohydrolase family protein [Polyangium sorediatum]|uniref:Amidohydrolase family protein n=1 Tax=Polyangium sorediatum TaxID=889274 RepID=A0ABT6NP96_9BACT|nr:amidohydrolase family protein [Polyangium sorediatum]MDI1430140.1 amidohydrolase family protein [Polyangium sorediatum]